MIDTGGCDCPYCYIDVLVDQWHETPGITVSLHDYLGLTWEEYGQWVRDCDLPEHWLLHWATTRDTTRDGSP